MKELEKANTRMSLSGVKKIGVAYMKQKKAGVPMAKISVARKRKQKCGSCSELEDDGDPSRELCKHLPRVVRQGGARGH